MSEETVVLFPGTNEITEVVEPEIDPPMFWFKGLTTSSTGPR